MNNSSGTSSFITALITGGLGTAIGTIGTAVVHSLSNKGSAKAEAADRVTNAAGNLADRLDKMNSRLEEENRRMRLALVSLAEAVEDLIDEIESDAKRQKIQRAVNAARIAFR